MEAEASGIRADEEVYSLWDGACLMVGVSPDCLGKHYDCPEDVPVAEHLVHRLVYALRESEERDEQNYRLSFVGYKCHNPFNVLPDGEYPREAYFLWWKLNCKRISAKYIHWFDDLILAEEANYREHGEIPPWGWSGKRGKDADVPDLPPFDWTWFPEDGGYDPTEPEDCDDFPPWYFDNHADTPVPDGDIAPKKLSGDEGLARAIDFGVATCDVLEVLADYLKRPPERQRSKNEKFPTEAQCVLDALDSIARRHGWGKAKDESGRLSKAQWEGVRALFLPETKKNQGCKGGRWGGKTDRD